jgi:hypothetical protein
MHSHSTNQVTYEVLMDIHSANADLNLIGHTRNTVMDQVNSPAGQMLHFFSTKRVTSQGKTQLPAPHYKELQKSIPGQKSKPKYIPNIFILHCHLVNICKNMKLNAS